MLQAKILDYLYDKSEPDAEQPFKYVLLRKKQSKKALTTMERNKGWITSTVVNGQKFHRITLKGIRILKVVYSSPRKADDKCANCRLNDRRQYPSRLHPYCADCIREKARTQYQRNKRSKNPAGLCARCKLKTRKSYPNGAVSSYCQDCEPLVKREQATKRHQRLIEQIQDGTGPTCLEPKCKQPVHYTESRTYPRCELHQKEWWERKRIKARQTGPVKPLPRCSVEGCQEPVLFSRGITYTRCSLHQSDAWHEKYHRTKTKKEAQA